MKVFASRRSRRKAVALLLGFAVLLGAGYVLLRAYAPFVFNPTALRTWIAQFGTLAPLVFILIQTAQVVLAPIPGQLVALVGGYIFGSVAGTVYSMIGVMLGSAIAFSIAKRWGRPVVERLLDETFLERFDGFVAELGKPGLLVFVLIPGLPDDAVCFLAGLTHFRLLTFLVIMTVGRAPAYIVTNFAGDGFANGQFVEASLAVLAIVGFSLLAYVKREEIRERIAQA